MTRTTEPLTAEGIDYIRRSKGAAGAEVEHWIDGLLATLDAAREGLGLDVERLAEAFRKTPVAVMGASQTYALEAARAVAAEYAALHSTNADPEPGQEPDHPLDGYAYEGCNCTNCAAIRARS